MALTDLIDLSAQPVAEAPLAEFLDRLCDRLGFDFAAYAGTNPVDGTVHAHVNYPEPWKAYYIEHGLHRVDPALMIARRSIGPVDWRRLKRDAGYDQVFRVAHDFGIGSRGVTIPVRGPFGEIGMLSVTRDASDGEWDALVGRSLGELQALAVHIHDAVMGSDVLSRTLRHPSLSAREREVLQWAAAGKSQADTAEILLISQRTVEVHLGSARAKLHALTTAQAVGRGVALGIIHPL
jgi:DNA-binding CsgD family transcriptional regulator